MMNIKAITLGGVALLALGSVASAADLGAYPTKAPVTQFTPVYNWTGLYFGLDAGGAFAAQPLEINSLGITAGRAVATIDPGIIGPSASGAVGGGWVGFNYQLNPAFVLGAEYDIQATGLSTSGDNTRIATSVTSSIPWQMFLEGKLGWLVEPNLMLSVHGGAALAQIREGMTTAVLCPTVSCSQNFDNTHTGWTVGAGLDWMITKSLGVRLKYNYVDLGTHGVTFTSVPGAVATFDSNATAKYNQATAGLFIHF